MTQGTLPGVEVPEQSLGEEKAKRPMPAMARSPLVCPKCQGRNCLSTAWTHAKGDHVARVVYRCLACGEAVGGHIELETD